MRLEFLYLPFIFLAVIPVSFPVFPHSRQDQHKQQCLQILKTAMMDTGKSFIRVHAAEALMANGYTQGIENRFTSLLRVSPANGIGCYRVLARLNKNDPSKYNFYILKLTGLFLHVPDAKQQLTALESLAKLGFSEPLPEIIKLSKTGDNGFRSMSRWILANSGKTADEERLAAMLLFKKSDDRLYAAYSFRFIKKISKRTYAILDSCANRLGEDDADRIYFACARYVHSTMEDDGKNKTMVLKYIKGNKDERYELAEVLAIKGTQSDFPIIDKLLQDEDNDVRVAAANAYLQVLRRLHG